AFPVYLNQVTALLEEGIQIGWTPAAMPLRTVPEQISGQIFADVRESPLYAPFINFPPHISAADRNRLRAAAQSSFEKRVMPALGSFHHFVKDIYLPSCRTDISASALKDGADYYQLEIRRLTTTDLTAHEIHEIGKREVGRIRAAMDE